MTVFSFNFNSMNSYECGRFQNWVVWFCRKCVFTISTWNETHLSCKIRCHLNVCMQQVTMISPCYYDCHIGCCISFKLQLQSALLKFHFSRHTQSQWSMNWDERQSWLGRIRMWALGTSSSRQVSGVISKRAGAKQRATHARAPISNHRYFLLCKAHLTCGLWCLCDGDGGLVNIVKRCSRFMDTWHTRAMIWIWILPPIIWALEEYIRSRNRITNNE